MVRVYRGGVGLLAAVVVWGCLLAPVSAQQGAAGKLVEQIRIAVQHASFSLDANNLQTRQLHAHHVINIIEGAGGAHFDAGKGNPADGYGAINYARDAGRGAAGSAAVWADNVVAYLQWADEAAQEAVATQYFAASGEAIRRALAFLSAALGRPDDQGRLGAALALSEGGAEPVTIEIRGFAFGDGQTLTVPVGTTVVWVNRDSVPHTVTGGPLDSPVLNTGDTFTFTFTEPGTYEYICKLHPSMRHTIVVQY